MKPLNKRSVIVGIFILLGILILIVAVFTLGGEKKTFVKTITVNAIFDDVAGLQTGGNVWYSGVKIGTVKSIKFTNTSRVLVEMHIDKHMQSHIHKDSKAKIGSDGLIGSKLVVLYGGTPASPVVAANDFLFVEPATGTEEMLATLQKNNNNLLEITTTFKEVARKISEGKGLVGTLINDQNMATSLRSTLSQLNATATNFQVASQKANAAIENIESFTTKLNTKGNSINELVSDTVIYTSFKTTAQKLRDAANNADNFSVNLKKIGEQLNSSTSPVGVLLHDQQAAGALKGTLMNLQSGSKKLDENLEAMQHNFLLRGFFKKREKAAAKDSAAARKLQQ
jgi:phospholipid/cholesterol/gamma-HCH transport system substrate-binding protein